MGRMDGAGPGSKDPSRINWNNIPLMPVLWLAYDVKAYQISGPDWLNFANFDIVATIPQGATREQFRLMLQNLLAERFKLALHHAQKENTAYVLSVGKSGIKFRQPNEETAELSKETPAASPKPGAGPSAVKRDANGFPVLPTPRGTIITVMVGGRARILAHQETMSAFVTRLGNQLGAPVTDGTNLKGRYDFSVVYKQDAMGGSPASTPAAEPDADPNIFCAMQQLGLKLVPKKGMIDVLVIDRIEKDPTGN